MRDQQCGDQNGADDFHDDSRDAWFFMQRMIVRSRAIERPEKRGTYRE